MVAEMETEGILKLPYTQYGIKQKIIPEIVLMHDPCCLTKTEKKANFSGEESGEKFM